ncbi:hypothetical protein [Niameybacter massiliensis]|uniref:hypothetical protein n=1 Tax=Niameybacter massiliensis TaxID=1658108 RepID=UPI0006B523B7|nr:hypothetical protein [Niameybacter massiliensis]
MDIKFKHLCGTIIAIYITGLILLCLGVGSGSDIATHLAIFLNLPHINSYLFLTLVVYTLVITGSILILFSFVLAIIIFIKHINIKF